MDSPVERPPHRKEAEAKAAAEAKAEAERAEREKQEAEKAAREAAKASVEVTQDTLQSQRLVFCSCVRSMHFVYFLAFWGASTRTPKRQHARLQKLRSTDRFHSSPC